MKTHLILAVISAVMLSLGILADCGSAQENAVGQQADSGVRVIDVTSIFKRHSGFQAEIKAMRREVKVAEELLQRELESIKKLAVRVEAYDEGSAEREKLKEEYARQKLEFNAQAKRAKAGFLERESEIYFKLYQQVKQQVRDYCEKHNVSLVLRFNKDDVSEKTTRAERLRAMNRPVVYQKKSIDITETILAELEQRAKVHTVAKPVAEEPRQ